MCKKKIYFFVNCRTFSKVRTIYIRNVSYYKKYDELQGKFRREIKSTVGMPMHIQKRLISTGFIISNRVWIHFNLGTLHTIYTSKL